VWSFLRLILALGLQPDLLFRLRLRRFICLFVGSFFVTNLRMDFSPGWDAGVVPRVRSFLRAVLVLGLRLRLGRCLGMAVRLPPLGLDDGRLFGRCLGPLLFLLVRTSLVIFPRLGLRPGRCCCVLAGVRLHLGLRLSLGRDAIGLPCVGSFLRAVLAFSLQTDLLFRLRLKRCICLSVRSFFFPNLGLHLSPGWDASVVPCVWSFLRLILALGLQPDLLFRLRLRRFICLFVGSFFVTNLRMDFSPGWDAGVVPRVRSFLRAVLVLGLRLGPRIRSGVAVGLRSLLLLPLLLPRLLCLGC